MVAFRFPPQGGVGALRSAALARHLPDLGWAPTVLAGSEEGFGRGWIDETHAAELDASARVHRVAGLDAGGVYRGARRLGVGGPTEALTLFLPRLRAGWLAAAHRRGKALLRTGRFDVVYSSSPPFACHLVAWRLSREAGVPWVADYRDLWSPQDRLPWPTPLHHALARRLESRVVRDAARVVTTSPLALQDMVRAFPGLESRISLVLNGFETDLFSGPPTPPAGRPPGFLASHVGSLPGAQRTLLIEGVRRALASGALGDNFHVYLVGPGPKTGLQDPALVDVIRTVGPVDHGTAVSWMRCSDLLLLVKDTPAQVAAKTFEYLASRKPVLALANGATAELVRDARAGIVVDPCDPAGAAQALVDAYRDWKSGTSAPPEPVDLERYTRRSMARGIAGVLDRATAAG